MEPNSRLLQDEMTGMPGPQLAKSSQSVKYVNHLPIGSMVLLYMHQYIPQMYPNVSIYIYTIHGSYGLVNGGVFLRFRFGFFFYVIYSDVPAIHTPNLSQHTPTAGWFNTQGGRFARWYTFWGCSASLEIWGLVAIVAGVISVLSISIIYPNFNGFHEFSMVMPGGTPQL